MGWMSSSSSPLDDFTDAFFGPTLRKFKLAVEQITEQSLAELQVSLETVNTAIQHPDSFPVAGVELTAKPGRIVPVLAVKVSDAQLELGILPTLLERKALILERINLLRPAEQIRDFRQEVTASVSDPETEHLLKVLDKHAAMEQERSERIERERAEVAAGPASEPENMRSAARALNDQGAAGDRGRLRRAAARGHQCVGRSASGGCGARVRSLGGLHVAQLHEVGGVGFPLALDEHLVCAFDLVQGGAVAFFAGRAEHPERHVGLRVDRLELKDPLLLLRPARGLRGIAEGRWGLRIARKQVCERPPSAVDEREGACRPGCRSIALGACPPTLRLRASCALLRP